MEKMKLAFSTIFALGFVAINASANEYSKVASIEKFQCSGRKVKGSVQITNFKGDRAKFARDHFEPYIAVSKLYVNGKGQVTLKQKGHRTYYKKLIPFGRGAWEYDMSRAIYSLGGRELDLRIDDSRHAEAFRLQIDGNRRITGYLGYREEGSDRWAIYPDDHTYDFKCTRAAR